MSAHVPSSAIHPQPQQTYLGPLSSCGQRVVVCSAGRQRLARAASVKFNGPHTSKDQERANHEAPLFYHYRGARCSLLAMPGRGGGGRRAAPPPPTASTRTASPPWPSAATRPAAGSTSTWASSSTRRVQPRRNSRCRPSPPRLRETQGDGEGGLSPMGKTRLPEPKDAGFDTARPAREKIRTPKP
jgi:hypothetical protein